MAKGVRRGTKLNPSTHSALIRQLCYMAILSQRLTHITFKVEANCTTRATQIKLHNAVFQTLLHFFPLLPTSALIFSPPSSPLFSPKYSTVLLQRYKATPACCNLLQTPPLLVLASPGQPQGDRMLLTQGTEQAPCQLLLEGTG